MRRTRKTTMGDYRRSADVVERNLATRSLSVRAATIDEEGRSVQAVLATEQPVDIFDFGRLSVVDEVLRVGGRQSGPSVTLLETHDRSTLDAVLGSVREIRREGDVVVGRLHFAADDERAERAWRKVRDGHITDVSVGYRVDDAIYVEPGESAVVDGKTYRADKRVLRVTRKWTLREVSVVPIGADQNAKIREAAMLQARKGGYREDRAMDFEQWCRARGIDPSTLTVERRAELTADYEREKAGEGNGQRQTGETPVPPGTNGTMSQPTAGEPAREPSAPASDAARGTAVPVTLMATDDSEIRQNAARAERDRIRTIREMAGEDVSEPLVERAINEGWDVGRASQAFLTNLRDARAPAVHARDHERDCTRDVLAAGLQMRAGAPVIKPRASEQRRAEQARLAEQGERYSDMSLVDICREALRLEGRAVPHSRQEAIRAAFSTSNLSYIFTTSVNAMLLNAYEQAPDTTDWCRVTDVADFKSNERTQLDPEGGLKRLPRGGAAEHTKTDERQETYKVYRYARQFSVDEQDVIDDRLDAFQTRPVELGQAAARVRPDLVYYALLANANLSDGNALFVADPHANYGTTSTALAASTLQAGVAAMAKQRRNGVPLNLAPRYLLVPHDLMFTAMTLIRSAMRYSSEGDYNPLKDLGIEVRSEGRLGVAGVTDPITGTAQAGTATNWFLAAGPMQAHTIEVGYLSGTGRRPTLRSWTLDKEGRYGIGWDVKIDVGVCVLDYVGLYKATGAGAG